MAKLFIFFVFREKVKPKGNKKQVKDKKKVSFLKWILALQLKYGEII
jgi:hypothetical protein